MPVQPVHPGLGNVVGRIDAEGDQWEPGGFGGPLAQCHACLLGRPMGLVPVAWVAGHDDVLPRGGASL